jgi:multicomponent Na+:H+ antiporter subunit G
MIELVAIVLLVVGCVFMFAGTVGLLRLPDVYCRLHAQTKADNLGLFLICVGLALVADSVLAASLLILIWLLGLLASTVSAHLIARHCRAAERLDAERKR